MYKTVPSPKKNLVLQCIAKNKNEFELVLQCEITLRNFEFSSVLGCRKQNNRFSSFVHLSLYNNNLNL